MAQFSASGRARRISGNVVALLLAAAVVGTLLTSGWLPRQSSSQFAAPELSAAAEQDRHQRAPPNCAAYGDIVQTAVEIQPTPQLNQAQLLWIASFVHGQAAARNEPGSRFLVFGLGYDSKTWASINCGGRTAFLENYQAWIDKITSVYPDLEVYNVTYRGRVDKAEAFFAEPWLMDLPPAVQESCFDIILVDAPQGYAAGLPGRMESSYFATQNAKRCIAAGQVNDVIIMLHDVGRKVEKQIIERLFTSSDGSIQPLGIIKGSAGDLAGFRVSKASTPS